MSSIKEYLYSKGYMFISKLSNNIIGNKRIFYYKNINTGKTYVVKITDIDTIGPAYNEYLACLILKNKKHDHIIKIKDIFKFDKYFIIIMKNYKTDLFEYINSYHTSYKLKIKILKKILKGLSHLHKNKIFHNDLKPENIFLNLNDDDEPKDIVIADFDCCAVHKYNSNGGTVEYLAPEVKKSPSRVSEMSDMFCFGKLINEIFEDDNTKMIKDLIQNLTLDNQYERYDMNMVNKILNLKK